MLDEKVKKNSETLMYFLTKNAARTGFLDFLESLGLTQEDYEKVKEFWKSVGITGTYV